MKREYVITEYYSHRFLCIMEDSRPVEFDFEDEANVRIGSIYIAKIIKIVPNLNAAFVDIGSKTMGYLNLDASENELRQGDDVMVQIKKAAVKTKDMAVSTDISISGKYTVLSLKDKKTGISKKITSVQRREELKKLFADESAEEFGIVVRTNADSASDDEIMDEYTYMKTLFMDIIARSVTRTCYSCLYEAPDLFVSIIRDGKCGTADRIITDIPEEYDTLRKAFPDKEEPGLNIELYNDPDIKLIKLLSIESCIKSALSKNVWLKSGGYIVIEPTEAMTVIDVNSGKAVDKKSQEKNYLRINLEAAAEIARQLRLRNISGIIITDFINMQSEESNSRLFSVFRDELSHDPVTASLIDMTKLGLAEVTRMKVHRPLYEILQ